MVACAGPARRSRRHAPRWSGRPTCPDPEKLAPVVAVGQRMRSALSDVLGRLEEARATKDVVKLNCVNEKLTQVKGLLRISEQSDVALQEAVARKDTTAAEHEYTKVTIARDKVDPAAQRGRAVHRPARIPHGREPDRGSGSPSGLAHGAIRRTRRPGAGRPAARRWRARFSSRTTRRRTLTDASSRGYPRAQLL